MKMFHYLINSWSACTGRFQICDNCFLKTLVFVLLLILTTPILKGQELDVMTFNILYSNAPPDNWDSGRRNLVTNTILQDDPDIMGLQEVRQHQYAELKSDLAATYTLIMPTNNSYFGNAIGFRKTRFSELSSGRFTYSPTPDIPGTDFHKNENSRYASWMILSDNQTNRSVFILSTHFFSPADQKVERIWSSQILMGRIQELANGLPIIAVGDFNMLETHDAYKEIVEYPYNPLTDTYRSLHASNPSIDGTVHGSTSNSKTSGPRIDYIFSAYMNILESEILHDNTNGEYPSDHYPVTTRFTYGSVPSKDPNIIHPGGIMGGQAFQESFDAQKLFSAAEAFGACSGAILYQWQKRVKDACSRTWDSWDDIAGANNEDYFCSGDTKDVQFRRGAKRSDCGNWRYSNIVTMDVSTSLSDPGEISGDEESCGSIEPDPLVSVREAAGGCGELEYMWQERKKDACSNLWQDWQDKTNETGSTIDPDYSNKDRKYRRKARIKGNDLWLYSNTVTIDVFDPLSTDPNCNCTGMTVHSERDIPDAIQKQIRVYPSPASSHIEIELLNSTTIRNLSIFSSTGQLVFLIKNQEYLSGITEMIDIQDWDRGIYIIKIETTDFTNYQKIIVQ